MTSSWTRWRLKSPASRLFTQTFIQSADQRKHQSSTSLAFAWGVHRWPLNSLHKGPVTRKTFPFDDVIMIMFYFDFSPCLSAKLHYSLCNKILFLIWFLLASILSTVSEQIFTKWLNCRHCVAVVVENVNFLCSQWRKCRQHDKSMTLNLGPTAASGFFY